MKRYALHFAVAAALMTAGGCTIGLPQGPIEPSLATEAANYFNETWLGKPVAPTACYDQSCTTPCEVGVSEPCECEALECRDCNACPARCPLLPPAREQPPYIDPGPPGRFFPVPVRPVFAPHAPYPELTHPERYE